MAALAASVVRSDSKAICYFVAAIGFAMAGVSMAINARYGQRMSVDADGWLLNGTFLCLLSMGPSALAAFSGKLSKWGHPFLAVVSFVFALVLVSYSLWNANDFLSDQMLGKMRSVERKYDASKNISEITNAEILRSRQDYEDTLKGRYKVERDPAERRRIEEKLDQLRNEPLKLTAPTVDSTSIDNRSSWLSKQTGIDRETIQAVSPTVGAILMAATEIILPWLGLKASPSRAPRQGGLLARLLSWRPWRKTDNSPANPRQFTKDEAREHLKARLASGKGFASNKEAAEAWGRSEQVAHKWLKAFRSEGIVRRQQQGRTKAVIAPAPHVNGRALGNA